MRLKLWNGKNRPKGFPWLALGWAGLGLTVVFAAYLSFLYILVTDRFEGKRWRLPSKVYSDSFILFPGQEVGGVYLPQRLRRLGYRAVSDFPTHPGEYRFGPEGLDLYLHSFQYPDHRFEGFPARIVLEDGRINHIRRLPSEEALTFLELEPELLAAFYDTTWEQRDLIHLEDLPPYLAEAVVSVEDHRFYQHTGIDPRSIARALWIDIKRGEIVQGGSTLTQQLVKNLFLNHDRTLTRKFNEILMALILDLRYSKRDILEAYLNEIYLAQSGSMGVYGIGEASRYYFGKGADALTLGESSLLAGMIKSPFYYSPFHNPERAAARRAYVLDRMLTLGKIGPAEYQAALVEPMPKIIPPRRERTAPYFVEHVRQELSAHYAPGVLTSEGLRIFTTLDRQFQEIAEETVETGLRSLEARYAHLRRDDPRLMLQGSLVVLQPQNGQIKAMVGGRDFAASQFNRITQARRQPGSLFKPFVYAAALMKEPRAHESSYTPATLIEDSPMGLVSEEGIWTPNNYDKTFNGTVTVRTALELSLNVATVRLADDVGLKRVIQTAHDMGIRTPLKEVPSLALGTSEVIPLEIASAYGTIANGGIRVEPVAVKEVVYATGQVLERRALDMTPVLTPQQAYLLTHLLEGVVDRGTARGVRQMGFDRPVAGKTGTTSQYMDAWFLGFSPDLLALVWVGFDAVQTPSLEETPEASPAGLGLTGAHAALPIWTEFMIKATSGSPAGRFSVPPGIVFEAIDPRSGLLSTWKCPDGITEAFIEGTEPRRPCEEGPGGGPGNILKWLKRLFPA